LAGKGGLLVPQRLFLDGPPQTGNDGQTQPIVDNIKCGACPVCWVWGPDFHTPGQRKRSEALANFATTRTGPSAAWSAT